MECQLKKNRLSFYQIITETSTVREENVDMIVPDMYPDIFRIVESSGMACLKEKELRDGRLEIAGYVKVNLLYVPEAEKGVNRFEFQIPFNFTYEDAQISSTNQTAVSVYAGAVEARMVNPRKVFVRAEVRIGAKVYSEATLEIVSNIDNAEEMGIQMLKKTEVLYAPIAIKDKTFTLVDELEIPSTKPAASEILKNDVILLAQESRVVGNKVVFKGAAVIKTIYLSAASGDTFEICPVEHELPFSQIIDMDGLEENCDCTFSLVPGSMDMHITGGVPDSRVFTVSLSIHAQAVAYARRTVEAIADIYSTEYELAADSRPSTLTHLIEHASKPVSVKEVIETEVQAASVLHVGVTSEPIVFEKEDAAGRLRADTQVSVLYTGEDGQLYSAARHIPVYFPFELPEGAQYDALAVFSGEAFAAVGAGGIEARFTMLLDYLTKSTQQAVTVFGVRVNSIIEKESADRPSVVLRKLQTDDTLWSIAKRHNTTVEELLSANGLDAAQPPSAGHMLLIPKRR